MSFTVRFQDGDLEIGSTGEQTLITNAEKAAQDLLDEILLPYDAVRDRGDELFKADGTLVSLVASPQVGANAIKAFIKSAVTRLMRAQSSDRGTSRAELIQQVNSIVVQALNNDPTHYGFFLSVTVDDNQIGIARAIRMNHLIQAE